MINRKEGVCEESILTLFKGEAARVPDKTALVFRNKKFSYSELDDITERLAAYLQRQGVGKGDVVSILVPRCEYMLITALGVLKSGAAYQPLDAGYPFARISYMMEDAQSALVIVSKDWEHLLGDITTKRFYMEDIPDLERDENFAAPEIMAEDLFVLLYTSGSTGVPKGCMLEHKNLLSFAKWYVPYYEVDDTCRMAEHASFVFDVSMMELFMPLTAGAGVYIIPEEIRTDLRRLNEFFEENGITHTTITTQLGRQFAANVENHSLRHLTVAGEALVPIEPPKNYKLHNGYGPTEGTILLTIQPVERYYEKRVPIGKPLDEVEIYVLDAQNRQVAKGETGELCAAGPHITRGYLNQPEQTAKVYGENPFSSGQGYEKIYHTGDLVRYDDDGLLEYLGRADRQVKIRGYRIELTEIEAILRQFASVEDATAAALGEGEDKYIAAYYVSKEDIPDSEWKSFIMAAKPEYMVPSYFVRLPEIPLNTNGKVDKSRLPVPKNSVRTEYEKPKTETEEKIAHLYEEILGLDLVGRQDHFFMLGGNSLRAAKLLFQLEKEWQCQLKISTVMENPVVAELAHCVEQACKSNTFFTENPMISAAEGVREGGNTTLYPASAAQTRMYTAQMMCEKGDMSYHLPVIIHIEKNDKKITRKEIENALREMFCRHDTLRTEFCMKDGVLMQRVQDKTENEISQALAGSYVDTERTGAFLTPFSMDHAPLFHWSYIEKEEEIQVWLDWHHSICDGTGIMLFCRELAQLCNGTALPAISVQYKDFAKWETTLDVEEERRMWAAHWQGNDPVLELKKDYTRPVSQSHRGGHITVSLTCEASEKLRSFCKEYAVTDYMFLFAGYFLLLQKYSRQQEIVVGTVMSGRIREELEQMQGMFVNTLPVMGVVKEEETYLQLLERVRQEILFVYGHQHCPLEEIAAELQAERTPSGNLLFDVLFVMQGFERTLPAIHGNFAELEFVSTATAMYDLTLEAEYCQKTYQFDFEYNTDLFARETIDQMARHFINLLENVLSSPQKKMQELSFIDEEEKQRLMADFQGERKASCDTTVVESLARQAALRPDKTAVVLGRQTLTYQSLFEGAKNLAVRLHPHVKQDGFAVVFAERSLEMIVSIWGILCAGGAYVPISPEYPAERICLILEDCKPGIILTCHAKLPPAAAQFAEKHGIPTAEISLSEETKLPVLRQEYAEENMEKEAAMPYPQPKQLAYMIYTSGTTGTPKGVMVEHAQLSHLLGVYTDIYELDENDSVLQFANFVFDQSVWDIFHILTVGGTLCLIPPKIVKDPDALEKYCNEKNVTVASLTPAFLRVLHPEKLPNLRLLDVGGEAPAQELLMAWSENRKVLNTYGPTETTVNATSFVFDRKDRRSSNVPIGRAIPNTQIYILQGNRLAGIGVPGELCIAGAGVTRGYWHREQLTAEKYVKNPFGLGKMYRSGDLARYLPDGNIEFLGRMDEQVKLRGYRIELGEVESHMLELDSVTGAAAVVKKSADGADVLCGYYTADRLLLEEELSAKLQERLPFYMVPQVLMQLDKIPLTVNGKVNKRALPKPSLHVTKEHVAAGTEKEKQCVQVWEEVLAVSPIGITEQFFELGGDSIKAIRIVSRLRELGYEVEVPDIFLHTTIKALAQHLVLQKEQEKYEEAEEIFPTPVMQQFLQGNLPYPSHFNQSVLLKFHTAVDETALRQAVDALICYHGALRMQWQREDGENRFPVRQPEEVSPILRKKRHVGSEKEMLALCTQMQREIEPNNGIMAAAQLFLVGESKQEYLFFTVHHLAVDEVSWSILLEDLNRLYRYACDKKPHPQDMDTVLPSCTISFGEWSHLLREYGDSREFDKERIYWETIAGQYKTTEEITARFKKTDVCGKRFITESRNLSEEATQILMKAAQKKYHARLDAILLAGLMQAVTKITGAAQIPVQMESHGRGKLHCKASTDRTVGWFTSVYPLILSREKGQEEQIVRCKELLNDVPNQGIGYGILRQQKGDFRMLPGFVMNYLGQSRNTDFGEFVWTDQTLKEEIHPDNGDAGTIAFNIRAAKTGMEIQCCYDECFSSEKLGVLLSEFEKMLEEMAQYERKHTKVVKTPSDLCRGKKLSLREWSVLKNKIALEDVETVCPLTPLQQGMLYHWMKNPEKRAYCILDKVTVPGEWKADDLRDSLALLAEKYDILRSHFYYEGMEQPWQVIAAKPMIALFDVSGKSFEEVAEQERRRRFDLTEDSLLRVFAFFTGKEKTELLISQHHIITDGWSFSVFLNDLEYCCRLFLAGAKKEEVRQHLLCEKEKICSFSQFVNWREGQSKEKAKAFWQTALSGLEESTAIVPYKKPSSHKTGEERIAYTLSAELETGLRKTVKALGITMSTVFETAWGMLLQRENHTDDVVFGKTVSGRNADLPGIEKAVGPFINTIPVRCNDVKGLTLAQLMKRQHTTSLEAMAHDWMSLTEISKYTDMKNVSLQTLFVYENYYTGEKKERLFTAQSLQEETNYPLCLCVEEQGGVTMQLIWDTGQLEREQIEILLRHLKHLLEQIAERSGERIDSLTLISEEENRQMRQMSAGRQCAYPKKTIMTMLQESAAVHAEKEAVTIKGERMSYRTLHQAACNVAQKLQPGGERYVAVIAERSLEMIAALCGTLYAGAAYVPIDPHYPLERIRYILEDCKPAAILTKLSKETGRKWEKELLYEWQKEHEIPVYSLEMQTLAEDNASSIEAVSRFVKEQENAMWNRAAYVIYTSGTTGRPKGVVVEHGSLSNMIFSNEEFYGFVSSDRMMQLANYVFDQSVMDIFNTLAAGGTLCLVSEDQMQTAESIEDFCVENKITAVVSTSAMMGTLHPERMGHLRLVDAGGDTAREEVFDAFLGTAEQISNSYGPTETTVNAAAFCYCEKGREEADNGYRSIPIGRPMTNKEIFVMQDGKMCGIGMKGELCIAGAGVARGYLNQKELTDKYFVQNPFGAGKMYRTGDAGRYLPDGNIEFCGRLDSQVKIRGYRIELEEIEQCMRRMEEIEAAAVVCVQEKNGRNYLSGFYVSQTALEPAAVKEELQKCLPSYMIPVSMRRLGALPLNQSGKVDVKKLQQYQNTNSEKYEAPRTYFEEIAAHAFESILQVPQVGRKDSFFDLGGSSIDVMKLISRLAGYRIHISDILQHPTPEKLGKLMASDEMGEYAKKDEFYVLQEGNESDPSLICLPPSGGMTLCYKELLKEWAHPGTAYGISDVKFGKQEGRTVDDMWKSAEDLADCWEETLSAYLTAIQKVWRDGDILLGYSQGGSIALWLASQLEQQGHNVRALIMLESEPFLQETVEEKDVKKHVLDIVLQMYQGDLQEEGEYPVDNRQIRQHFEKLADRYYERNQSEWDAFVETLTKSFLVVKSNVSTPLVTEGNVHCPIYSIQLAPDTAQGEIQISQNPWQTFTQAEGAAYGIGGSEEEHLVFLTKYRKEIAAILKEWKL